MQPIALVLQRDNCLIEMGAKWNGGTNAFHEMLAGEPDVGNPQVRFDEGQSGKLSELLERRLILKMLVKILNDLGHSSVAVHGSIFSELGSSSHPILTTF